MTGPHTAVSAAAVDLEPLGRGLGQRVRDVAAAVRRLDGLNAGGLGTEASRPGREDVREFVLRALRVAADRDNNAILRAVVAGTRETTQLAEVTGRPRLALWEAVGDLVQVGLLERDPVADRVQITAAGAQILAVTDLLVLAGETP
jgi:hypothetical protein